MMILLTRKEKIDQLKISARKFDRYVQEKRIDTVVVSNKKRLYFTRDSRVKRKATEGGEKING